MAELILSFLICYSEAIFPTTEFFINYPQYKYANFANFAMAPQINKSNNTCNIEM